jgi:hypothetical protein
VHRADRARVPELPSRERLWPQAGRSYDVLRRDSSSTAPSEQRKQAGAQQRCEDKRDRVTSTAATGAQASLLDQRK